MQNLKVVELIGIVDGFGVLLNVDVFFLRFFSRKWKTLAHCVDTSRKDLRHSG